MTATILQTNFTAGELSPRLYGRTDVAKFANAAKTICNATPLVQGGVRRRAGLRFVHAAKLADSTAVLLPFVFNRDQAYMLEFGDHYMRVYKDGALVLLDDAPYEIATPYAAAMLAELNYAQGADTMFLAHGEVPVQRLQRFDHNDWRLLPAPFSVQPFDEIGEYLPVDLALSDGAVGAGRTVTASDTCFLPADVGRDIHAAGLVATITAVTSDTDAVVTVVAPLRVAGPASFAAGSWVLAGSPQASCVPSAMQPVGASITLTLGSGSGYVAPSAIGRLRWNSALRRVTVLATAHGLVTGDTVAITDCVPASYNGTFVVSAIDVDNFSYFLSSSPGGIFISAGVYEAGTPGTVAKRGIGGIGGWRSSNVEGLVRINGGLVKITSVESESVAHGDIMQVLSSAIAAETNSWSLGLRVWNARDGYPRTLALAGQRLYAAGSPGYPETIWASAIGNVLDFALWVQDDDAFAFTVDSNQINPVSHIVQNRGLLALTYGGEFTLSGGVEKPITPTNIQVTNQSSFGTATVRPVRVGNELVYVQRDRRKVRALSYQVVNEGFQSVDVSVLAEHLTAVGIAQMAYQQAPDSMLWLVRSDGVLLSVTYDRDQEVIGWARHETAGFVEAVACIPTTAEDQVWCLVRRVVNGATVRYVELLDPALNTDAAMTGADVDGASVWSGLAHLEGCTVDVLADGVVMPSKVVSGGAVTLERAAQAVEIGLHYQSRIDLLTPELQTQTGSAQGKRMRSSQLTVRLLESIGCRINDEQIPFRQFGAALLDAPVQPFTGEKRVSLLGWERGFSEVSIIQDQPLPLHVLAVIREFTAQ